MNAFEQLVKDLDDGTLSLSLVRNALRQHYRHSEHIPDGIKSLVCGVGESDAGLIFRFFQLLSNVIGSLELANRRGEQQTPRR